jgi:hypothetical protein
MAFPNPGGPHPDLMNPMAMANNATLSYLRKYAGEKPSPNEIAPRTATPRRAGSGAVVKTAKKEERGSKKSERRGRPKKISDDLIQKMIQMLESSSGEVSWEDLGHAVGVEGVHLQTIRNYMVKEGYCKRVSCQEKWLTRRARETRMQYALAHQHWQNEWRSVLFSDVVNFGLGASRKARVFNRKDERLCEDCLQSREEVDKALFHCWAMVGYDYKSPLIFYTDSGTGGAAFSQQDYITGILRPHVQPITSTKRLIFLEDAHGIYEHPSAGKSLVQAYMDSINLPCLRNPQASPDLNIAKDILLLLKKRLQKRTINDENQLRAAIVEEWDKITTKEINKLVDSMKFRMEKVLLRKGMPI